MFLKKSKNSIRPSRASFRNPPRRLRAGDPGLSPVQAEQPGAMHRTSSVGVMRSTVGRSGRVWGASGRAATRSTSQQRPAPWMCLRRSNGSPSDVPGAATRRDWNMALGADHGVGSDRGSGLAGARRPPTTAMAPDQVGALSRTAQPACRWSPASDIAAHTQSLQLLSVQFRDVRQSKGGWALSRQAVLFIKGASAATFASTAVVAACAGKTDAQGNAENAQESAVVSLTR